MDRNRSTAADAGARSIGLARTSVKNLGASCPVDSNESRARSKAVLHRAKNVHFCHLHATHQLPFVLDAASRLASQSNCWRVSAAPVSSCSGLPTRKLRAAKVKVQFPLYASARKFERINSVRNEAPSMRKMFFRLAEPTPGITRGCAHSPIRTTATPPSVWSAVPVPFSRCECSLFRSMRPASSTQPVYTKSSTTLVRSASTAPSMTWVKFRTLVENTIPVSSVAAPTQTLATCFPRPQPNSHVMAPGKGVQILLQVDIKPNHPEPLRPWALSVSSAQHDQK